MAKKQRQAMVEDKDGTVTGIDESVFVQNLMDVFGLDVKQLLPGTALVVTNISGQSALYENGDVPEEEQAEMVTMTAVLHSFMMRLDREPEFMQEMLDWHDENCEDCNGEQSDTDEQEEPDCDKLPKRLH